MNMISLFHNYKLGRRQAGSRSGSVLDRPTPLDIRLIVGTLTSPKVPSDVFGLLNFNGPALKFRVFSDFDFFLPLLSSSD